MPKPSKPNKLYFGDNLPVLRDYVPDESVDLIYLDPPFNSKKKYNVLYAEQDGTRPAAQIKAFKDTWHWDRSAEGTYAEIVQSAPEQVSKLIQSFRSCLGQNDVMAYLVMMAIRLVELRRVLKPTGSIYLHCDPTAGSHLKVLMDAIFSPVCFRNEITWKRTFAHGKAERFGPIHDTILFYTKSQDYVWTGSTMPHSPEYIEEHFTQVDEGGRHFQPITLTGSGPRHGESGMPWRGVDPTAANRHWALPGDLLEQMGISGSTAQEKLDALDAAGLIYWPKRGRVPRLKWYADRLKGMALPDVWVDIPPISARAAERLGYPTQKPEVLLERVIEASSREGDLVLDPFCGCGTTVAVAQRLRRRWIGIDITHLAIGLIRHRLRDHYGDGIEGEYDVLGAPADVASARALAEQREDGRYQFQWWALDLVDARAAGEKKKGADKGIDGVIFFLDEADTSKAKKIIVSVKSGHVGHSDILELRGVVEKEAAQMGFFITLEPPTRPMRDAAVSAGFYDTPFLGTRYPKIQILTIEDLLAGKKPERPPKSLGDLTFRKAPRAASGPAPIQGTL